MKQDLTTQDIAVLKQHATGEFLGTLTGRAERREGRPILYNIRTGDGHIWAYETNTPKDEMKWVDCAPTGQCESGIGVADFEARFF